MPPDITLTITLPAALAASLRQAAAQQGWSPESLAADCVAQHLEVAIRHRVLLERAELVDAALLGLTRTMSDRAAASEMADGVSLCRYPAARDPAGTR
jgi:hypothetical protein